MKIGIESVAVAASLMTACGSAMAQSNPVRPAYDQWNPVRPAYEFPSGQVSPGPTGFQLGDSFFFASPSATLAIGHDSNVTLAPANEVSSTTAVLSARVDIHARLADNVIFRTQLAASRGIYNGSSADNYISIPLGGTFDMRFSPEASGQVGWTYLRGVDARGTTDRAVAGSPDEYYASTPAVKFVYGRPSAQGRLEFFASREAKRYLNNRNFTEGSDRNTTNYGGAFYWRVAPKTNLVVEARESDIDYLLPATTLSGSETRYFAGVTWDATALTSGNVKVGRQEKRFDSNRPTFNGTSWEALITWKPRTYSSFDLYTNRSTADSTGLGDFILTTASGVNWNHAWNSLLSTTANARLQKDAYKGFGRTDDITSIGMKANYRFRRWLTLSAEYQHTERDSNQNSFDYDKNLWLVSAAMSM